MAEVEKIASDRYRVMNVSEGVVASAQDLRDIYDWCLLHLRELKQEAKEAQAYQLEDTQERMEHRYLGGE